jgi:hypothetical protein
VNQFQPADNLNRSAMRADLLERPPLLFLLGFHAWTFTNTA